MHFLLLLLRKYIQSVIRVIRIRLYKYHLVVHFYVVCTSTTIYCIFFIYINSNISVPSYTLASGYQRCTWYYYQLPSLLDLLLESLKLVKNKQSLPLTSLAYTYIYFILSISASQCFSVSKRSFQISNLKKTKQLQMRSRIMIL